MNRNVRRQWWAAALAAILLPTLAACGNGDDGDPEAVTLGQIVADQASYDGDLLRIEGVVVGFENPEHYVVEDEQQNRVQLLPTGEAAAFEGEQIVVVGRFAFSEEEGRRIEIEEIEAAE